jgi:hypothetical protein
LVQQTQSHPFEYAKSRLITSSRKLYQYQLAILIVGIALVILILIALFVFLVPLGFSIETFDPTDIYAFGDLFAGIGIGLLSFGLIFLIGFAILGIMIFIQYYKLGNGYDLLAKADPSSNSPKNASYGFYGYIIATIIGIFVPGYAGTAVNLIGTVSLAAGFYFAYKTLVDYQTKGQFPKKPSLLLVIAGILSLASSIITFFTLFGTLIGLLVPILMVLGFRELTNDLTLLQAPGMGVSIKTPQESVPSEKVPSTATTYEPSTTLGVQFCSNCGAKAQTGTKFCENCGANL